MSEVPNSDHHTQPCYLPRSIEDLKKHISHLVLLYAYEHTSNIRVFESFTTLPYKYNSEELQRALDDVEHKIDEEFVRLEQNAKAIVSDGVDRALAAVDLRDFIERLIRWELEKGDMACEMDNHDEDGQKNQQPEAS